LTARPKRAYNKKMMGSSWIDRIAVDPM